MNVGVLVTNIKPFSERHKFMVSRVAVRCVTRTNQVSVQSLARVPKIINTVQLQPVSLVEGVIAPICRVANIELEEEPAVERA